MGEIVKIILLKLCNNISFDGGEGGKLYLNNIFIPQN